MNRAGGNLLGVPAPVAGPYPDLAQQSVQEPRVGLAELTTARQQWGEHVGSRVVVTVPGRDQDRYGTVVCAGEEATVRVGALLALRVRTLPDGPDEDGVCIELGGALARMLVDQAVRQARRELVRSSGPVLANLVEAAMRRSFGCTCRQESELDATYVEDLRCPLHGQVGRLLERIA